MDNHAYKQIDLDELAAVIGPALIDRHWAEVKAVIVELRAARNVVGGAQTMRSLYPHIWEEYSRNGLMQALADYEDSEV